MTFASHSYSIRQSLNNAGHSVSHGYVQQLLAASIGYNSLAAYQATPNEKFGNHILVDMQILTVRCIQLSMPGFERTFLSHLASATPQIIHWDERSLEEAIEEHIQQNVADHDGLSGTIALTNAAVADVVDIEVMGIYSPMVISGPNMLFPFSGVLEMDHDLDRVFYGDKIELDGLVSMQVTGRRCLGDFQMSVSGDVLDDYTE